jgi:hypothetical protein
MGLEGEGLIVTGHLYRVLGIIESRGKVAKLALHERDFQITERGGVMRQLVGFVIGVKRELIFVFRFVDTALRENLRDGVGILSGNRPTGVEAEKHIQDYAAHEYFSRIRGFDRTHANIALRWLLREC